MPEHIIGLDHVVVVARDLERAARDWRALGFTLSPRGTHSAHLGTGNYTIMLGDDYVELLGVLSPTAHNAPTRDWLARREGVERAAFTTTDADAGAAELRARGVAATDPMDFGRPVELPDGASTQARFRTFNWPLDERPAGLRLFACQHLTRSAVWIPELQRHANTATGIARLELLSGDPGGAARNMSRLIDRPAARRDDGAWQVPSGSGRGDFVFVDREGLARRYPGVDTDGLGDEGVAALVLRVRDAGLAARALKDVPALACAAGWAVPPARASGLVLVFEPA